MRAKCEKIVAHGINCFVNRQLIYNLPEQIFAENGVMAIEHADFVGVERLAAVTGGEICSTFDHPELVTLGECDLIEEVRRGQTHTTRPKSYLPPMCAIPVLLPDHDWRGPLDSFQWLQGW